MILSRFKKYRLIKVSFARNYNLLVVKDDKFTQFGNHLQLFHNVVSEEEECQIVAFLNPVLSRKRYEGNHWDDVIAKYKELELSSTYKVPVAIEAIFRRIEHHIKQALEREDIKFITPHVIDLAKEGHIAPHVDSIKFSGDLIAALSLNSLRVMELTLDRTTLVTEKAISTSDGAALEEEGQEMTEHALVAMGYPPSIEFAVPSRSMYILTGPMRYNYAHAIHGVNTAKTPLNTTGNGPQAVATDASQTTDRAGNVMDRRLSVMFRNTKLSKWEKK